MKRKHRKAKRTNAWYTKHSLVIGLISDILRLIRVLIIIVGLPVRLMSMGIAKAAKKYPRLRWFHSHEFVTVCAGFTILVIAFAIQRFFHPEHVVAESTLETMKAAGVCPMWSVIESRFL